MPGTAQARMRRSRTRIEVSDRQLLERFAAGRGAPAESAFEALLHRHGRMVLSVCRKILRNRHEADDAFQATFLVLVRRAGEICVDHSLGNWLYGVACKVAVRARSDASRRRWADAKLAEGVSEQTSVDPSEDLAPVVLEEVGRLPAKYRDPVVLCYFEGLTHDQAAARLACPLGTVKGRLARARNLLRGRLARRGITATSAALLALFAAANAEAEVSQTLIANTLTAGRQARLEPAPAAGPAWTGTGWTFGIGKLAAAILAAAVVTSGAGTPGPIEPKAPRQAAVLNENTPPPDSARSQAIAPGDENQAPSRFDRKTDARAALTPPPGPTAYETGRGQAGRDADGQVKLALWCEAHGLEAERIKHLALAVLANPRHATARGLLGLVPYQGRWKRPAAVVDAVQNDPQLADLLARYQERRARTPNTAEAQWKLVLWCEQNGLKAEAIAHGTAVTRLDPNHEAAWKRLGCRRFGGRWLNDRQIAQEWAQAIAQARADRYWRPLLEKWRAWLTDPDRDRRSKAERGLATVADPLAVPAIWAVFGQGKVEHQKLAVQLLGQAESPASSRALANLAVFSPSTDVRRLATETLLYRDPREFVEPLIGLMYEVVKYEVQAVNGPGSVGVLLVEGKRFDVKRLYAPPPLPKLPVGLANQLELDADGWAVLWVDILPAYTLSPLSISFLNTFFGFQMRERVPQTLLAENLGPNSGLQAMAVAAVNDRAQIDRRLSPAGAFEAKIPIGKMVAEIQKTAAIASQQLEADIQAIERYNQMLARANAPIIQVLRHFSDREIQPYREAWLNDWRNSQGYAPAADKPVAKPTLAQTVPLAYQPQAVEAYLYDPVVGYIPRPRGSCFGAGTLVHTLTGPRPIESIAVGDQVLTQDPASGALGYHPVIAVFHNRPAAALHIDLGDDAIVATGIHRLWKAGTGWVMARELRTGDAIRTLDGLAHVRSIESEKVQPVFNLEIGGPPTYFVGKVAALAHDNTLVQPTRQPFDTSLSVNLKN